MTIIPHASSITEGLKGKVKKYTSRHLHLTGKKGKERWVRNNYWTTYYFDKEGRLLEAVDYRGEDSSELFEPAEDMDEIAYDTPVEYGAPDNSEEDELYIDSDGWGEGTKYIFRYNFQGDFAEDLAVEGQRIQEKRAYGLDETLLPEDEEDKYEITKEETGYCKREFKHGRVVKEIGLDDDFNPLATTSYSFDVIMDKESDEKAPGGTKTVSYQGRTVKKYYYDRENRVILQEVFDEQEKITGLAEYRYQKGTTLVVKKSLIPADDEDGKWYTDCELYYNSEGKLISQYYVDRHGYGQVYIYYPGLSNNHLANYMIEDGALISEAFYNREQECHQYCYNKQGKLELVRYYDPQGNLEISSGGELIQYVEETFKGNKKIVRNFQKGKMVCETIFREDRKIFHRWISNSSNWNCTKYYYDTRGNLIKECSYYVNRWMIKSDVQKNTYRYDSDNNLVERKIYSGILLEETTEYRYDKKGNVRAEIEYRPAFWGKKMTSCMFRFYKYLD